MADVRSLLRQQRAARRIDQPYAAYSDSGKLLCTLCHEAIKAESMWEGHVRSKTHVFKLQQNAAVAPPKTADIPVSDPPANPNKRKHDTESEDEDAIMDDDAVLKKRSRTDMNTPARSGSDSSDGDAENGNRRERSKGKDSKEATLTPPSLTRRTSTTPSQGVEIQIPSRPATPHHRDTSSGSTPIITSLGPSPLIPQGETPSLPRQPSNLVPSKAPGAAVNEDEWAAFEADIAATSAPYSEDAVISAPAMSTEQQAAAAQSEEEEREKRRLAAEQDLADEKEEASRALEAEFDEMEELEARVRKLKERREALRNRASSSATDKAVPVPDAGNENVEIAPAAEPEDEEEEDDSEDEEDDFMGFRYNR